MVVVGTDITVRILPSIRSRSRLVHVISRIVTCVGDAKLGYCINPFRAAVRNRDCSRLVRVITGYRGITVGTNYRDMDTCVGIICGPRNRMLAVSGGIAGRRRWGNTTCHNHNCGFGLMCLLKRKDNTNVRTTITVQYNWDIY